MSNHSIVRITRVGLFTQPRNSWRGKQGWRSTSGTRRPTEGIWSMYVWPPGPWLQAYMLPWILTDFYNSSGCRLHRRRCAIRQDHYCWSSRYAVWVWLLRGMVVDCDRLNRMLTTLQFAVKFGRGRKCRKTLLSIWLRVLQNIQESHRQSPQSLQILDKPDSTPTSMPKARSVCKFWLTLPHVCLVLT